MIKVFNKNRIVIFSLLLLFSIVVFSKTLFKGEVFAWYNDQLFQHNIFYQEWYRIIRESIANHTLAVFSWNTFLGTDYLATKLMYCVGDFLITPFFVFHNGDINFDMLYAVTTIISIVLSGINISLFLEKFGTKKNWLVIVLSIAYALGGFACIYTGSYMFHRFYTLLPLLFYFTEVYLENRKVTGFVLITSLLFLQSYELLFSTCFFLVAYFIFSEKIKNNTKLLEIFKKSGKLIIAFLTGIAICGIFLLPLILYLKTNQRVGLYETEGVFFGYREVLGLLTGCVIPTFNLRSNEPLYLFNSNSYFVQEYGLFVTLLILLALILVYKKGTKREKKLIFGFEILIFLCLIVKPINSIIHGFSVPTFRWSFVLELYHIVVTAYVFEKYDYDKSNTKTLLIINCIYIVLYLLYFVIYKIDLSAYCLSALINLVAFAPVYIFDLLLSKGYKRLLCITVTLNVITFYCLMLSQYGIYQRGQKSYNVSNLQYQIYNDEDKLSRYYFDSSQLWPYSSLNLNNSIENNYCGVSTYDSTYSTVLSEFLAKNGYINWMIDIDNYDILNMLGVKYYVLSEDTNVLKSVECTHVNNFNNFKVYKDNNNKGIAYTISNYVTEEKEEVDWGNELIIKEQDAGLVSDILTDESVQMNVIEYNRQYLKGSINVNSKTVLFVAIPYSEGWNVVDQDGNKLTTINVNNGFLGVVIDTNVKELNFYYGTPGLKLGLMITVAGFICLFAFLIDWRRVKHG